MKTLAVALLLPILFVTSGCATTGRTQTKQTIVVDVLKPTQVALANFQDTEIALFKGGEIPQLTPQLHMQIAEKLELAFRAHASAVLSIRAWQPGQPVPVDLMALKTAIDSIVTILRLALPPTSPLISAINVSSATINTIIDQGVGR